MKEYKQILWVGNSTSMGTYVEIFYRHGYEMIQCENINEAKKLLEQKNNIVLILRGRIRKAEELKKLAKNIPIIILLNVPMAERLVEAGEVELLVAGTFSMLTLIPSLLLEEVQIATSPGAKLN
ncbi:hypothetical protein HOE31_01310 [bacterium]|nr:hypothetical protein [bacterium]MBT4121566.1 hypothetical protein [bacterium]MBT4335253.1 hypothetical protein [bacterium]MBT4495701.1 hypothetical protein [bacterium]MBT4763778.1 hypothetical protein [bacterium]